MFEHSNFAVANAIKISPGPSLLMFKHSNFAEPNVNQTFGSPCFRGFTFAKNTISIKGIRVT